MRLSVLLPGPIGCPGSDGAHRPASLGTMAPICSRPLHQRLGDTPVGSSVREWLCLHTLTCIYAKDCKKARSTNFITGNFQIGKHCELI